MFKHRRIRTAVVLAISWTALTGVERWGEDASWQAALLGGLGWGVVITGVWWFVEWTQIGPRSEMAQPVGNPETENRPPACRTEDG